MNLIIGKLHVFIKTTLHWAWPGGMTMEEYEEKGTDIKKGALCGQPYDNFSNIENASQHIMSSTKYPPMLMVFPNVDGIPQY